ncbi:MAG: glycosyltransferase [Betaproteobacteria bacterium]|nr:glycosyltransferase [Betaproteobacteria bacterium]
MSETLPLSVCMIVRNESHHLPKALASVKGIAAEVVVVDTGSTDDTVSIATAMGAKVLHFDWIDDFAAARNAALEAAKHPWILSLDADQQLAVGSASALKTALQRTDCMAQVVTIDLYGPSTLSPEQTMGQSEVELAFKSLRLFRNHPQIRFSGRVHEDVSKSLLTLGQSHWPNSDVVLADHGYAQPEERDRKRHRNLLLLRRVHQEQPNEIFPAYKLATTLLHEYPEEGHQVLQKVAELIDELPSTEWLGLAYLPKLVAAVVDMWRNQGRLEESALWCAKLHAVVGDPLCFATGMTMANAGHADEADKLLSRYLELPNPRTHPLMEPAQNEQAVTACLALAGLARKNKRTQIAREWLQKASAFANEVDQPALDCENVEIELSVGDLLAATQALEHLHQKVSQHPSYFANLMYVSAKVAQASGDNATALVLVNSALGLQDDRAACLLASLEIEAGDVTADRLEHHFHAIPGQSYETLAIKLIIGRALELPFPHDIPLATLGMLEAH